eukprot:scaffold187464_cov27-Tisochrysis_lutea.AAC.1
MRTTALTVLVMPIGIPFERLCGGELGGATDGGGLGGEFGGGESWGGEFDGGESWGLFGGGEGGKNMLTDMT